LGVALRDRAGGGRLGDERDVVAEVECDPRRGLAALLGADAAHDDLGDALLGEQLLEVGGRERVVRGLGELRLTSLRLERADVADVAASRSNVVRSRLGLPVISLRRAAACVRGDLLGCRHELRTSSG
jgi:hypothetical protein